MKKLKALIVIMFSNVFHLVDDPNAEGHAPDFLSIVALVLLGLLVAGRGHDLLLGWVLGLMVLSKALAALVAFKARYPGPK